MQGTLSIAPAAEGGALAGKAFEILCRELGARTDLEATDSATGTADVCLAIDAGVGEEAFAITGAVDGPLRIAGGDERGLLYGVGRFLHTSQYSNGTFSPTAWRGTSVPETSVRGIYMANNFRNWNCSAPVEEVVRYCEELALWGLNTLAFNFPYYRPGGGAEVEAQHTRNVALIRHARALGIRVALLYAPNTGFGSVPEAIRAEPFPDADPPRRGNNPTGFVCPSKPEGRRFILDRLAADLDGYAELDIDYVVSFPYDAGGCGCADCWPWGARGYLRLCEDLAEAARERFPACRFVLGTWCFDVCEESDGEFEGLDRALRAGRMPWCDMLMTDAHGDFPRYPLEHGSPGGLPMINFAEISMWGRYPWGGSGANPLPARIERIWRQAAHLLDGGLPYSEGRFEDINKVCCLQLDWDKQVRTADIVRDYANYEYGSAVTGDVCEAVAILERIYPSASLNELDANRAFELLGRAREHMLPCAAQAWRWRILYLRAVIDAERAQSPDVVTAACNDAYEELTRLYCARKAGGPVAPPSRSFYERDDIELKGPVYAEHIGEHASDPRSID